jgi:tRNA(Ile)-lysidine synthase
LWRYIKNFGFTFEQSKEIVSSLFGQPGKRFLSSSHLLVVDRELLIITALHHDWHDVNVKVDESQYQLGPWQLSKEVAGKLPDVFNENEAFVDESTLAFPLTWRKWRAGDAFFPLGMEHKKKLSDFFIDKKVSMADKELVTILESEGKIVWVAGHRIDDRFKVTSKTTSMLKFTLTRG